MRAPMEVLHLPWHVADAPNDEPFSVYVDSTDGGTVNFEIPDVDHTVTLSADEWVQIVEFVHRNRLRSMQ